MHQRFLQAGTVFDVLPQEVRAGLEQVAHLRVGYFDLRVTHGAWGNLVGIEVEDQRIVADAVIIVELEPIASEAEGVFRQTFCCGELAVFSKMQLRKGH